VTTSAQWWAGARPRTLPAAVAPVVIGTALAGADWIPARAFLALIVALALQIGVNYANDYSDGIRGTDADRVGPLRLVGQGIAAPRAVRNAAFASFLIAALAGLLLIALSDFGGSSSSARRRSARPGSTPGEHDPTDTPVGVRSSSSSSSAWFRSWERSMSKREQ